MNTLEVKTTLLVIESHEPHGVEWSLSFDGHNPSPEDNFVVKDKETAFRLKDRLAYLFPSI